MWSQERAGADGGTRGSGLKRAQTVCRICAVAPAAVNSQLCCLRQREKERLCLCGEVVQEGVEEESDPSIGCLATVTLPTHSSPFQLPLFSLFSTPTCFFFLSSHFFFF